LSQARTPDLVHPRRCARILVAVAVKTSSQYLHLTLVLSPGVFGSSCWTTWACSGPFSLTMAAVRVTQLWFVQVRKTDWIPHSSASKTNEECWSNVLIRKDLRRAKVFFSFVREITLQPAHRLSPHPPV
jgi:hypothetical protein